MSDNLIEILTEGKEKNYMNILITGGTGYIGSHTVVLLQQAGYQTIIVDNLSNSSIETLEDIKKLSGSMPTFYQIDLCEEDKLKEVFEKHKIDAVIHFAGLKAVGESVAKPLLYYKNNLVGTLNLLNCMKGAGCKRLVFSSSATVYGDAVSPMKEEFTRSTTNPYGATKRQIEEILEDLGKADPEWAFSILRYFNPVGAHPSGLIGENPNGIPNNLVPYIAKVATDELESLKVFGNDYDTKDGTGVRDYIHVMDLAEGHLLAVKYILNNNGVHVFNLGTGNGYSVLEVLTEFGNACGKELPYQIVDRRPGDIAVCYADATKAKEVLNWNATRDLSEMCRDHWNYQRNRK